MLVWKRFGRWQNAIRRALNEQAERHYWTDEELLDVLRNLHKKLGRFPEWEDVRAVQPSLTETLRTHFGSFNAALERALGTSPQRILLQTIASLTPPPGPGQAGCDVATTQEIVTALRNHAGIIMTPQRASVHLSSLHDAGIIERGKYSRTTWWRLTQRGRTLLKSIHD
jgi:hypothetical protein